VLVDTDEAVQLLPEPALLSISMSSVAEAPGPGRSAL